MWSCDRVRSNSARVTVEDVRLSFQTGSEPDRIGTQTVEIAYLQTITGRLLGSLALSGGMQSAYEMQEFGFSLSGALVEVAENGHITERLGIAETWEFTIEPD